MAAPHAGLTKALLENGIKVNVAHRERCVGAIGLYETGSRRITVCQPETGWTRKEDEVMRHEVIHAIQHCRGGLDNMTPLQSFAYWQARTAQRHFDLTWALMPYFQAGLPEAVIDVEAEAWARQGVTSEDELIAELNSTCQES